jgi:hypothetical protein
MVKPARFLGALRFLTREAIGLCVISNNLFVRNYGARLGAQAARPSHSGCRMPLILGRMAPAASFGLEVFIFRKGMFRDLKVRMALGIGTRDFINPQGPICRCDEKGKYSTFGSFGRPDSGRTVLALHGFQTCRHYLNSKGLAKDVNSLSDCVVRNR